MKLTDDQKEKVRDHFEALGTNSTHISNAMKKWDKGEEPSTSWEVTIHTFIRDNFTVGK